MTKQTFSMFEFEPLIGGWRESVISHRAIETIHVLAPYGLKALTKNLPLPIQVKKTRGQIAV